MRPSPPDHRQPHPIERQSAAAARSATQPRPRPSRGLVFAVLCLACLLVTTGYASSRLQLGGAMNGSARMTTTMPDGVVVPVGRPVVLFRSTSLDDSYGALAFG